MLSKTLIALTAFSTVALASPNPGVGVNVVKQANYNQAEKAAKISLKEICYRNLYADVSKYKVKYSKEVLAKDAAGKAVFLFDGIKKDINNREFYYEEFCYKQFNIAEHNADVAKHNTAVVGGAAGLGGSYGAGLKGSVHKRSMPSGGLFDHGAFLSGWGSIDGLDGYGSKGLGLAGGAYGGQGFVGAGYGGAAKQGHANDWAGADHYNDGANYAKANHAGAEQNFGHNKEYNHANGAYDRAKGNAEEYNNARKYGGNAGHGNAYNSGADMAEHEANNNGHAAAYGSKLGGYGGYGGHLGGYGGGYGGYGGQHLGAGYGGGYGGYGGQHLGGGYGGGYGGFEGGKGGYSSY